MNSKVPTSILTRAVQVAIIVSVAASVLMSGQREVHIQQGCHALAESPGRAKALEAAGFETAALCRRVDVAETVGAIVGDAVSALLGGAYPSRHGPASSGVSKTQRSDTARA